MAIALHQASESTAQNFRKYCSKLPKVLRQASESSIPDGEAVHYY